MHTAPTSNDVANLKALHAELFELVSFIESVDSGTCPEDSWPTIAEYNQARRAHTRLSDQILSIEYPGVDPAVARAAL